MGNRDAPLRMTDLMLLVVDATGGAVEGRTIAQKLAYFVGVEIGRDLSHQAHFYGPFSRDVEEALALAVVAGDLSETVERIPDWYGGPDARRYSYALTDEGSGRVEVLKAENPDVAERVAATVERVRQAVPDLRQKTLSSAAKIHLIVSEQGRPVVTGEIPRLAARLGWELTQDEVDTTVDVLRRLELVE